MEKYIENFIFELISKTDLFIEEYWIKIFFALLIIIFWLIISILVYNFILFLFKKFKIVELLEKFEIDIYEEHERNIHEDDEEEKAIAKTRFQKKHKAIIFKKKIKVNNIAAKAWAYYVFLLFFRWSMVHLWISEIEQFLKDVIEYLPSLFVWIMIWYFWIRFAGFIYDVVYHGLNLAKEKTASIIASASKIIILFFTLMLVLDYTKIVDKTIIDTIFIWFISMLTISWWLAFGLWWKDIAQEILESFRK